MNQELIIELAFKAGFVEYELDDGTTDAFDRRYEKFASLIASAEREACAKVCVKISEKNIWEFENEIEAIEECVAAIRARGETT
jgi:hypothetical protein